MDGFTRKYFVTVIILSQILLYFVITLSSCEDQYCTKPSENDPEISSCQGSGVVKPKRYILYDINPPEGFNLRRDVYMRMAVFASKLPKNEGWHLVLPPWARLYHWRSTDIGKQNQLPWNTFFDVPSLQKFAPVIEMFTFLADYGKLTIERVFILQHFKDAFEANYSWEEKFDIEPCREKHSYRQTLSGTFTGRFWDYTNVTALKVDCLSFHGLASQLARVAPNAAAVMFDHAEIALHDSFGDPRYWRARRSMRFAANLRRIADEFRIDRLNSSDAEDGTVMPEDWRDEKPRRDARGGPYLCAHLRRQDFLVRGDQIPSIKGSAEQIKFHLDRLALGIVFVATDANAKEIDKLKSHLRDYQVILYEPSFDVRKEVKDGGVAIIEQIICSHARYFIGTHESTFSFRIQEEREIIGFPVNSTFNRLCGDLNAECPPPTQWKIVY